MTMRKALLTAAPWIAALLLFASWEAFCRVFNVPVFLLPKPSESIAALIDLWPGIWPNAAQTLATTLVGFGMAVVIGLALGVAVGSSAILHSAVIPLLLGFHAIPKVALVPILVLWFGIGTIPAVLTAFLTAL